MKQEEAKSHVILNVGLEKKKKSVGLMVLFVVKLSRSGCPIEVRDLVLDQYRRKHCQHLLCTVLGTTT